MPCTPSMFANATEGAPLALAAPPGLSLVNFSDPQQVFAPGSAQLSGGRLSGTVAAGVRGHHLVFGYAATDGGGLPQTVMFKLSVSAASAPPPALPARPAASWRFVPLGGAANADLRDIFKDDTTHAPKHQNQRLAPHRSAPRPSPTRIFPATRSIPFPPPHQP